VRARAIGLDADAGRNLLDDHPAFQAAERWIKAAAGVECAATEVSRECQ
jgi:hypothetical protein